jgi:hypothetical protein
MTTTNDRPDLSSEGAPAIDKTVLVNVNPKLISGHETHMGLESRTYWPTDRRSYRDFDFELPSAWGYSWATLSPGVINTER